LTKNDITRVWGHLRSHHLAAVRHSILSNWVATQTTVKLSSFDINVLAVLFECLLPHAEKLSAELISHWHTVSP
jgi:hypothetical protein